MTTKTIKMNVACVIFCFAFAILGGFFSKDTSMVQAEDFSTTEKSMESSILSTEDAVLQNYTAEDLKATQMYLLDQPYHGKGHVVDADGNGYIDAFDLGKMRTTYKESGNYYDLLFKFTENCRNQFSVSSENDKTLSNRVIVQATQEFDFSEFNPTSIFGDSEYYYILQFDTISDATNCVNALKDNNAIVYAEMDGSVVVPPEEDVSLESNELQSESSFLSWGVSAIEADKYASYLSQNFNGQVTVAVVDTGVAKHSFLNNRILGGGRDIVNNDDDPSDDAGHGTHVAGTIVDCTPGLNINILPIKVLDSSGSGSSTQVIAGIKWARQMHADVINLSLGPDSRVTPGGAIEDAINRAVADGIVVVKSAGNENDDTQYHSPSNSKDSIVVASVDSSMKRASDSNFGESVDLCAPGVKIKSSVLNEGYAYKSGTSMAAPHVAAAAAMVKYQYPNYSPAQIESTLVSTCEDLGPSGKDIYYGYGIPKLSRLIKQSVNPSISLSQTAWNGYVGEMFSLKASVTPNGQNVIWSSSDTSVATVSNGSVTAQGAGTATIIASFVYEGQTYSASCSVSVKPVTIELSETNKTVYQTDTFILSAKTEPQNLIVSWSSSDNSIVSVTDGNVTAISPGNATVTATISYAGRLYSTSCTVTVKKVSVELSSKTLSLLIGDDAKISAITSPEGLKVEWDTSNTMIASVSNGSITANAPGKVDITATMVYNGKQYTDTCAVTVNEPSIQLTYKQINLSKNETITMLVDTLPDVQKITWSSEDPSICTIDSSGVITAKSIGNTMVTGTITYAGKTYSDSCNVIVGQPKVSLSDSSLSLYVSDTHSIVASVIAVDGSNISNETRSDITWSSSDTKVATVDNNGAVKAVSTGTATITATYRFCGIDYTATCKVSVDGKPSISLNKLLLSLYIGDTSVLTETVTPSNAAVTWSSSDTSVATVNSYGKVTAISSGYATITASFRYNGVEYHTDCYVSVTKPTISLSSSRGSIYQGDSISISATTEPGGYSVSWSSSNSNVASVSGGKITGKSAGSATITARFTYGGNTYSATYSITVKALSLSLSSYSGSGSQNVWDGTFLNDGSACGNLVNLPSASYSPSGSVSWSVISGSAKIVNGNKQIFFMQPGTVKVRCVLNHNGYTTSKDYTYTLSLYKITNGNNNIRSGAGSGYASIGTIPAGTTVTITQLALNGKAGESGSSYWGKVSYNGTSGWIIISQW